MKTSTRSVCNHWRKEIKRVPIVGNKFTVNLPKLSTKFQNTAHNVCTHSNNSNRDAKRGCIRQQSAKDLQVCTMRPKGVQFTVHVYGLMGTLGQISYLCKIVHCLYVPKHQQRSALASTSQ